MGIDCDTQERVVLRLKKVAAKLWSLVYQQRAEKERSRNSVKLQERSAVLLESLFFPGGVSLGLATLLIARIALTDARRFAAQSTQVIEFGSAHATSLHNVNVINDGCMQWKYSLDPNAETRLADSYCLSRATVFAGNNNTLKGLQTFFGF
jgi:hypothetical protein